VSFLLPCSSKKKKKHLRYLCIIQDDEFHFKTFEFISHYREIKLFLNERCIFFFCCFDVFFSFSRVFIVSFYININSQKNLKNFNFNSRMILILRQLVSQFPNHARNLLLILMVCFVFVRTAL
jgi:hypothetical protein